MPAVECRIQGRTCARALELRFYSARGGGGAPPTLSNCHKSEAARWCSTPIGRRAETRAPGARHPLLLLHTASSRLIARESVLS